MFVELITLFYLGLILYPVVIIISHLNWLSHKPKKAGKVAIIGSGIAGCGAAWVLRKAGWEVTIYETRDVVGGNAKVHTWDNFDDKPQTGLSVLAWPMQKFHNYNRLIEEFNIEWQPVNLPFFSMDSKGEVVAHGVNNDVRARFDKDFEKWENMNAFIKKINVFLSGSDGSLYNMSYVNPFNLLPLKTVSKLFGISGEFWSKVVEPVYSSTFLSRHLDFIPAVVGPTISEIVPLSGIPQLVSWKQTSQQVFDKLVDGCRIKTSTDVEQVIRKNDTSEVFDKKGNCESYDNVIFACPPDVALNMIDKPTWLQKLLLSNISYPETETTFEEGIIHNDASVLPSKYRNDLLSNFANFIDITYDSEGNTNIENTFLLSAWVPSVQKRKEEDPTPMLITYNTKKKIANPRGIVTNKHAHPALSLRNLAIGALLRFCQGIDGNFFCSSFTTPGNGHDMSLLSGFAVGRALGADYPFKDDQRCSSDFEKLCSIMGVHVAEK